MPSRDSNPPSSSSKTDAPLSTSQGKVIALHSREEVSIPSPKLDEHQQMVLKAHEFRASLSTPPRKSTQSDMVDGYLQTIYRRLNAGTPVNKDLSHYSLITCAEHLLTSHGLKPRQWMRYVWQWTSRPAAVEEAQLLRLVVIRSSHRTAVYTTGRFPSTMLVMRLVVIGQAPELKLTSAEHLSEYIAQALLK